MCPFMFGDRVQHIREVCTARIYLFACIFFVNYESKCFSWIFSRGLAALGKSLEYSTSLKVGHSHS